MENIVTQYFQLKKTYICILFSQKKKTKMRKKLQTRDGAMHILAVAPAPYLDVINLLDNN